MDYIDEIEVIAFAAKEKFVFLALKSLNEACENHLRCEDGLLYHASPVWRLLDSHIIRLSEVPPVVAKSLPFIIEAVKNLRQEAMIDQKAWDSLKGSGARRSHVDVKNLSDAPHIIENTTTLLRNWGVSMEN